MIDKDEEEDNMSEVIGHDWNGFDYEEREDENLPPKQF